MTKTGKTTGRMPNAALMKPVQPDDALAMIVESTPLPRGELTKKLWDYIKKNKLQDEKKRTLINADDALKVVFGGKKQVSMFEMTKLVSGHVKQPLFAAATVVEGKCLRFNVHVHATFQWRDNRPHHKFLN